MSPEDLGPLGGYGHIPWDDRGEDTANSLDSHGQGSRVQQYHSLGLTRGSTTQDSTLYRRSVCYRLIWIDIFYSSLPPKESYKSCRIFGIRVGPPTRTKDGLRPTFSTKNTPGWIKRFLEEIIGQLFKTCTGQSLL
jgi:hypothetical protein